MHHQAFEEVTDGSYGRLDGVGLYRRQLTRKIADLGLHSVLHALEEEASVEGHVSSAYHVLEEAGHLPDMAAVGLLVQIEAVPLIFSKVFEVGLGLAFRPHHLYTPVLLFMTWPATSVS